MQSKLFLDGDLSKHHFLMSCIVLHHCFIIGIFYFHQMFITCYKRNYRIHYKFGWRTKMMSPLFFILPTNISDFLCSNISVGVIEGWLKFGSVTCEGWWRKVEEWWEGWCLSETTLHQVGSIPRMKFLMSGFRFQFNVLMWIMNQHLNSIRLVTIPYFPIPMSFYLHYQSINIFILWSIYLKVYFYRLVVIL